MVNTVRVNADRGHDFNPHADHMTKLNFFYQPSRHTDVVSTSKIG